MSRSPRRIKRFMEFNKKKERHQQRLITGYVDLLSKHVMAQFNHLVPDNFSHHGMQVNPGWFPEAIFVRIVFNFYKRTLHDAQRAAALEGKMMKTMRLAKDPIDGTDIPDHLPSLEELFRDRRLWPKVMKESEQTTKRVRSVYLKKLQAKFSKILPALNDGSLTPQDAKAQLKQAWNTTKSRVELIFRTETTTYYSQVQKKFFEQEKNHLLGFMFDSIGDRSRTDWCKSRDGIVYRPNTAALNNNTPPCFLGSSPILTLTGWQCIDTVGVGDYVWTHENRFRPIEKVHCTIQRGGHLLQIGYAMATPSHPYLTRNGDYVEASKFRAEEGVWSIPGRMQTLWQAAMVALLQKRPALLQKNVQAGSDQFSEKRLAILASRKSMMPRCASTRKVLMQDDALYKVYNLDVYEDQTYIAGGYASHNCHWNCRSHLIPLANTEENRKLLEERSRNPEFRKVVPLPSGFGHG